MTAWKIGKANILLLALITLVLAFELSDDLHLWRPGKVVWDFRKSNAVSIVGWPSDPQSHYWLYPRMDFNLTVILPGGQTISGKMRLAGFERTGYKLEEVKFSGEVNSLAYWSPRLHALMVDLHFKKSDLKLFDRFCAQSTTQNYYSRDIDFEQRKTTPFLGFELQDLRDDDPAPQTSHSWAPTFIEYWFTVDQMIAIDVAREKRATAAVPKDKPALWDFRKAHTLTQIGVTAKALGPLPVYPVANFPLTMRFPGGRTFSTPHAGTILFQLSGNTVQSLNMAGDKADLQVWKRRVYGWLKTLKFPPAASAKFATYLKDRRLHYAHHDVTLRDSNSYPAVEIDLVRLHRHKNGRRLYNGGLEVYWLHNMPSGY